MLHVHPSIPARSVAELVKVARARPGQIAYGTPGIATGVHLTTEYFAGAAGIKLNHVPYKGSAPLMVDMMGGNIDMVFTTLSTSSPHLATGRLRALAIAAGARAKNFLEIPTMTEAGYRGFEASTWHGFVTRAGVPASIVARLNSDFVRTRLLMMVGVCLALNEPVQLANHVRGAMLLGAKPREVLEVIVQSTAYCGMPTTLQVVRVLEQVAREDGRIDELMGTAS